MNARTLLIFIFNGISIFLHAQEGFVAGTLVKTPTGYTPIEQLHVDDLLISYDSTSNTTTIDTVTGIQEEVSPTIITFYTENENIEVAPEHLFYSASSPYPWIKAEELLAEAPLHEKISGKKSIVRNLPTQVYRISVKNNHTYFVSLADILVHNTFFACSSSSTLNMRALGTAASGGTIGGIFTTENPSAGLFRKDMSSTPFKSLDRPLSSLALLSLTNKEAREKAAEWGYKEKKGAPFNPHGKPTFTKGTAWLTPDKDGHGGTEWKKFDLKGKRLGSLDTEGKQKRK